ncbi:MAG: lysylphosphatidylglycerol synthase transmembrane domain-containing protein [Elusimicrobiales bacterium]
MKKSISIAGGFAVSAALIWLAARKIDFRDVAGVYGRPGFLEFALVPVIVAFMLLMRGLRWKLLVLPCARIPVFQMTKLETMGLALNNVLPLRLGEIGRATIGAASTDAPFLTLLSTIVVERVLDAITLGVIFAAAITVGGAQSLAQYAPTVWAMVGATVVALAMLIFLEEMLEHSSLLRGFLARFPKLDRFARQIGMGAQALRDWKLALAIIALGAPLWLADAFGYFWAAHIIGLTPALSYGKAMVTLCTAALAVAMPSAPGFFGAFELALQRLLMGWGVNPGDALAYAAFVHLNGYILITLTGIIFLYGAGHSLGGVWKHLSGGAPAACPPQPEKAG